MLTQNESKTAKAATKKITKNMVDGGNPFYTKLEATEGNTTTGMGSIDDLLGISFSGFNHTPSNAVPPSSFSFFDSSFSAPWS